MKLDKSQIIQFLQARGESVKAHEADTRLPDHVDTDEHSDVLVNLGVDPKDVLSGDVGVPPGDAGATSGSQDPGL